MKQQNKFLLKIVMDLSKIHDFLIKQETFSAGFELGALLNTVVNHINDDEREAKDAKVQEEEGDEECEEGSEEEDSSEDSYLLEYQREKAARIETENALLESEKRAKKLEETNKSINETKRCIFELQDLLMRLVKFRKINLEEVENVLNILRNTGVDKSDINVICKGLVK
jgi:hypothetical protein